MHVLYDISSSACTIFRISHVCKRNVIFITTLKGGNRDSSYNNYFIFRLIKLQNKINIFDEPDGFRKLQKKAVPPIGGFIIFFNVILIFFILLFNKNLFFFEYPFFYENQKIILRSFFSFYEST